MKRECPAYPSASLGVLVRSSPPLGWSPSPGAAAPACSGHGPVPAPQLPPRIALEVAFPFLSLKRRRRGHLPTARRGRGAGRSPRQNSWWPAARRWGAVDRGSRPARSAPAPGPGRREARLGARRGAGAQEAHPAWGVPKPGGRRLLPGRPPGSRRASGGSRRALGVRRREGIEKPRQRGRAGEAGVAYTFK